MFQRTLIAFVVIVIAAMALSAAEMAPPPALEESSEVAIRLSYTEPTPVTQIYRAVGKAAGIEVIFDPGLNEPRITLEIDTSTTSEALDLVCAAAGDLWVPTAGNTVIVADDTPQNRREYDPILVRSFVLENGSVREADKLLRSIVEVRRLSVNEELRTVTVREAARKIPIIEHLIALADHAPGEIDARIELLLLTEDSGAISPPSRFYADEYVNWRRSGRAEVLTNSTLSLLGNRTANLHLGTIQDSGLALDLRLEGRVHPESRDVSLVIKAMLAPTDPDTAGDGTHRPERGRIETSARVSNGSTLLLPVPGSAHGAIAIAITPTIVRSTDFDPAQLAAFWVGTEMRIQAPR